MNQATSLFNATELMFYPVLTEGILSFVIPLAFAIVLLIIEWWRISDHWPKVSHIFNTTIGPEKGLLHYVFHDLTS